MPHAYCLCFTQILGFLKPMTWVPLRGSHHNTPSISLHFFPTYEWVFWTSQLDWQLWLMQEKSSLPPHSMCHSSCLVPLLFVLRLGVRPEILLDDTTTYMSHAVCDGLLIMSNPPWGRSIIEWQHPAGYLSLCRCCRRNSIIVAVAVILIIYCWDSNELVKAGHLSGQKLARKDLSCNMCLCRGTIAEL